MDSPFKAVAWNASPKPQIHSSMGNASQMHENLGENALDLGPLDFIQIYQSQHQRNTFPPSIAGEVSQNLINRSVSLGHEKQSIHPLALDTTDNFCNYFDQASMIKSGAITQALGPMSITPPLDTWSPTRVPDMREHQLFKASKHVNINNSVRSCQIQRRREQNRAAQRAFRARKEKYTRDLENDYGHLVGRYNELVQLLRDVNVDQSGAASPQELSKEEQLETGGESGKEKCRCQSL